MTDTEIFLVDSNILIYAHDKLEDKKHNIARDLIESRIDQKLQLAVSAQNLSEFFNVTTRKSMLTKKDAKEIVSDIINFTNWIKIDFTHKTVLEAAEISEQHSMSYWDSLLAATMKQNSILNIYTENIKDFKVPWLNVVDPFEKKPKKNKQSLNMPHIQ